MWCDLLASAELPAGTVRGVEVGGRRLVVWRTVGGEVAVADARCPHQWADLPTAGIVAGDELICGVHGWRFTTDGTAAKLSARGRRDDKGTIALAPVREREGRVQAELSACPPPAGCWG